MTNDYVIAIPGDRPPCVTFPPCDYRGLIWDYLPATREGALEALDIHRQEWADWPVDERLLQLANSPPVSR